MANRVEEAAARGRGPSRRAVLVGGLLGVGALGGGAALAMSRRSPDEPWRSSVPDAAQGEVRRELRRSAARGREVGFFTAVPAGYGDGRGLPVCLVLHGASATTADFERFGLGRFLTQAVRQGAAPFVLAGADGGRSRWLGDDGDDPQLMLREEVPAWCAERGYDAARLAAYGWSMGGFGALRLAEAQPSLRAVAALSPAVAAGDEVFADAHRLGDGRTALYCGTRDGFLPAIRALADAIPGGPAVASYGDGGHTRVFWNDVTPRSPSSRGP